MGSVQQLMSRQLILRT